MNNNYKQYASYILKTLEEADFHDVRHELGKHNKFYGTIYGHEVGPIVFAQTPGNGNACRPEFIMKTIYYALMAKGLHGIVEQLKLKYKRSKAMKKRNIRVLKGGRQQPNPQPATENSLTREQIIELGRKRLLAYRQWQKRQVI